MMAGNIQLVIIGLGILSVPVLLWIVMQWMRPTAEEDIQPGTQHTRRQNTGQNIDHNAVYDPEIQTALAARNKIGAIKRYRKLTGVGLKEAKDAIDYLTAHPAGSVIGNVSPKPKNNSFGTLKSGSLSPASSGRVVDQKVIDDSLNDPEFQQALANGQTIEAIKRYRELTGVGLKEAKDFIEDLVSNSPKNTSGSWGKKTSSPDTGASIDAVALNDPEFQSAMAAGNKIAAIKRYRELADVGLKDAKDLIEDLAINSPKNTSAGWGKKTSSSGAGTSIDAVALNDPAVREAVAAGNKIAAIKRYRELTGAGLKEAKDAIDHLSANWR